MWYDTKFVEVVESVTGTVRTYAFIFNPDPEGGFVVTCPALPGLVTHGETLDEARTMARDAMEGMIEAMLEDGENLPESDTPQAVSRLGRLARTLQSAGPPPIIEQLTVRIAAAA